MLGYVDVVTSIDAAFGDADVVTSIGAAFGDAVVGVGNLQPLLHLVSPDHYPPLYSLHPLQQ